MKNFLLWLFLLGITKLFGQPYIADTEGLGKYGYLDKNATTYIRLNSGSYGNIYQLFARTWTGSSQLTYGTPINSCGGSNVNQNTGNYSFASGMSPGSIAYTSAHADFCGGTNSYGGDPNTTGSNEKQHYIFELTGRNSDLSSDIVLGNKNVVMSAKIDFGSLSDRKLNRFWIKNSGTFLENTEIPNGGFKIYYEAATGSETFDGTESSATIYGDYGGNSTSNNEYGHDALDIAIPSGGLRVYVVLETLATCSPGKTISVSLLDDGLSFSPVPSSNTKNLARVNSLPASPVAITYNYPSTSATPATQTVDLYAAPNNLAVSVPGAVSYQWYRNTVANNTGGTIITGATSSTYSPPTGPSDDFNTPGTNYYYAVVTTGAGSCDKVVSTLSTVVVNNSNVANWANIQFPKVDQNLYNGVGVDVFAQVYISGSTPGIGQAPNVSAWIGYSTTNTNPNTWPSTQWIPAVYNPLQSFREDFNDEYWVEGFGKDLPAGTYYVASRFLKDGGANVYGGIDGTTANETGGIWNGTTYFNLKLINDQIVTWTGSAWNNVTGPKISSPAIIAGDASSPPSFSAKNLTINSGVELVIPAGQSVTLDDELINDNGTSPAKTLVVESGGNFIQNHDPVSNSGKIRVKRNASVPFAQYNFWSSPVTGQDLYTIYQSGNAVTANRVFTYNTLTDYYTAVSSGTFAKGIGYSIKGESAGNSNAVFFGVPHNGDATVSLNAGGQRYNLIGNPYPSNIDAAGFYSQNQTQIENTLWFWDNTGNAALSQMGSNYSTYATNNFATYNIPSGVGNSGTATQNNASKVPDGKIVIGQGFIVQAKNIASPAVTFKNSMRTSESGVFFARQDQQKDAFWLQLISPNQITNTTAIVYNDNAQNNLDDFDSEMASLGSDALYSLASNDSKKLSIQGRNASQLQDDKVKIGVQYYKDGTYTFSLNDKKGLFGAGRSIYLVDKQTGIYTDLQSTNYVFSATKGLDENRFEIVYKENAVLGTTETKSEDFLMYRSGDSFVVQSAHSLLKIEVYSVSGQLLKTYFTNDKTFRIPVSDLPVGVMVCKVDNDGHIRTKKILK